MTGRVAVGTADHTHLFRAFWPITDNRASLASLIQVATPDLPLIAARAHATVKPGGRWSVQPSFQVPGSGRVTATVLVYESPGTPRQTELQCPRCRGLVPALVEGSGVCIPCDADIDLLLPAEVA